MTIKEALELATKKIQFKNFPDARYDAEIILSWTMKKNIEFFYTYPEKQLTKNQIIKFKKAMERRLTGEPIAYILKNKNFFGLDFYVDKNVLIPRPETEQIVELSLDLVKKYPKIKTIADIGCGSGVIITALAKNLKNKKLLATEISKQAIYVAKKNFKIHKVKIDLRHGNLLNPIKNEKIDLLVANLPYVKTTLKLNKPETLGLKFEPKRALFAGTDGLDYFKKFFKQLTKLKNQPKFIILEIGDDQTDKIRSLIKKTLPKVSIEIFRDLNKKNRFIQIQWREK